MKYPWSSPLPTVPRFSLMQGLHLNRIVMDHIDHITISGDYLQEDDGQLGRRPPLPPQVVEATPGVDEQGACQHD